jgi:hypothetical protein
MPFEDLDDSDPVLQCLSKVDSMLTDFVSLDVLANGKLEKQLKLFMAAAWMRQATDSVRACVMDKRFNRKELDLLALEAAGPAFWVETKCSFREDPTEARISALDAIAKIRAARLALDEDSWPEDPPSGDMDLFRKAIRKRPAYIVHFLNSVPKQNGAYPEFVIRKFPSKPPKDVEWLRSFYAEQSALFGDETVRCMHTNIYRSNPRIDAMVLRCDRPPAVV